MEIIKGRSIEKWDNGVKDKFLKTLTPRLARDARMYSKPNPPISGETITSVYYWGDVGTGKTVYAVQLLIEEAKRVYLNPNNERTYENCIFISVPELFNLLKSNFNNNDELQRNMDLWRKAYFLVLDDIGAEKTSEWALTQLYLIINYRYEQLLPTIITSNKSLKELAEFLGDDRITSRIRRMGEVVEKRKRW
jgi:DNA replication protein DnaC